MGCPSSMSVEVPDNRAAAGSDEIVRVINTVSVRRNRGIRLPPGYYGNSFVCPSATSEAGKLCESPLAYALELVKKARAMVCEEYVRSVTDLMVIKGRPPFSTSWNYFVSDTRVVGEVDFGWGKPVYGGPVGAWTFHSPCSRTRNRGEEGTVVGNTFAFGSHGKVRRGDWENDWGKGGAC